MSDDDMELARRLARFKLGVRRSLGESVNLDALRTDLDYRTRTLADIEERTDDEDLLVSLLLVRDMLERRSDGAPADDGTKPGRDYRFGARSG
ncbi:MAG: hypothetical protein GY848_02920 [Methyloversatilis sp.]|jgi:hypothetical protein|uniref:Uncharacterized protein n=1 Tax=Methyloversatilis universalis (strain ATCC BAA-1314 / DSM 25237 / JCM 13912 / CCUG 52030 / FAM5) TaxID=1000565 RepID=F5RGP9_METUF|nr:hypothetical protein [Methyloversatilis universalis]EGK70103.1 hypothetical protein METUNv1_03490 [Methyloversatilis universalis FAM5]MCP4635411.1 hypothetical protein [Methyloversatilis sp.]